jgi:hypothetical protein
MSQGKRGRPRRTTVNLLYNKLHSELYNIYTQLRTTKHPRGPYFKMYFGNTDLNPLLVSCEKIVNIVHSIETAKLGPKPLLTREERLKYLMSRSKK